MSLFGLGKRGEELAKGLMDLLQQPQAAQTNLLNVSPQEIERIKRGEALGYNMSPEARLYHASKQDIDKLEAGYDDGLIFTTPDPEFANKWLGKGRFNERQGGTGAIEGIKAEKKRFRKEQNEIMKDMTEEQREKYFHETVMPQQRQLITDERLADNAIYPLVTKAKKPFIPDQDVNVLEELYGKEYMAAPFGSGFPTYRDALKDGNYLLYENKQVVDFLKSKGYDSMFLKESAGAENPYTTLASFDAKDLKSPYAQFKDPNNPNLLASAGALGLMSLFAPEEAEAGISKIKAFHGSPHDFDKFSAENIGTGEGAQAFGRGLYFAERRKTAESYRDALTKRDMEYEDWLADQYSNAEKNQDFGRMEMYERAMMHDLPKDFRALAKDVDYDEDYRELASQVADELEAFTKADGTKPNFGSMYEVDINASPDELLDFDQPLDDQPEKIKKLLAEADWHEYAEDALYERMMDSNPTGGSLLRYLEEEGDGYAAQALRDAGIKGIKYADAQTRFSPKGKTHNFVIFDDKLIDITRKYGIPPAMATAVLAGTMTPEQAMAMAESEKRKGMSRKERRDTPASSNLQDYARDRAGRALTQIGKSALKTNAEAVDFLRPSNIAANFVGLPQMNRSAQQFVSPITDKDALTADEGKESANVIGSLLSFF